MSAPKPRDPIDKIEYTRNLLAFLLIGAFIGALVTFSFRGIPTTNKDILIYMVGQLSGMAQLALGFYFVNKVGADALDAKRADNTGKAMEAIAAAAASTASPSDTPQPVVVTNAADDPVPTTTSDEEKP